MPSLRVSFKFLKPLVVLQGNDLGLCPAPTTDDKPLLGGTGVNVALGIDDKGINDDNVAIMELRMIHKLHRVASFDLANTPPLNCFDVLKIGTVVAAFIHRAKGIHVNTVIVGGKVVMEDRKILALDVNELYNQVRKAAAQAISSEQKHFAETLQKIRPYYHAWYAGWEKLDFKPFYMLNSRQ